MGCYKGDASSDKDGELIFNLSHSYQVEYFPLEQSWSQTNVSSSTPGSSCVNLVTWTY